MKKDTLEMLELKLANLRKDYDKRAEYFKLDVENMLRDSNFERNAFSTLGVMLEIKSQIKELDETIRFLKSVENQC